MRYALALASLASFVALAGCSRTPPCENDTLAFTMTRQMIERQLGPSAKVASITEATMTPATFDGKCGFVVSGPIDGQNAFGGPVRQRFRAEVLPDATGDNWSMRKLEFF